ncbi:hypothetical protein QKW35_18800 [Pontibacterium granulatum]|uniref:hypothetical protein n=1 Tax=Pontibacterium granulatum TaxID=2036029 RepID=UPI00249B164A|nr:hypothetical protein [Pontibacterium granulatum]MDI3326433.1 hypothetical protein [Pontibacterium granulatum]
MEFVTDDATVQCIRIVPGDQGNPDTRVVVATFDSAVETIAPHVAAKLSEIEIRELELWLEDRAKLQAELNETPAEIAALKALPQMIDQACDSLGNLKELDRDTYQALMNAVSHLSDALAQVQNITENARTELNHLQDSEELKEKLDAFKHSIGD